MSQPEDAHGTSLPIGPKSHLHPSTDASGSRPRIAGYLLCEDFNALRALVASPPIALIFTAWNKPHKQHSIGKLRFFKVHVKEAFTYLRDHHESNETQPSDEWYSESFHEALLRLESDKKNGKWLASFLFHVATILEDWDLMSPTQREHGWIGDGSQISATNIYEDYLKKRPKTAASISRDLCSDYTFELPPGLQKDESRKQRELVYEIYNRIYNLLKFIACDPLDENMKSFTFWPAGESSEDYSKHNPKWWSKASSNDEEAKTDEVLP